MAVATGAFGNSSNLCEDLWIDYVKEKTPVWKVCEMTRSPKEWMSHDGCPTLSDERDREMAYFRQCDNSNTLLSDYMYNFNRKMWLGKCNRYPNYPEFDHFKQGAPKSRAKSRQRKHHHIFDVNDKGIDFSGFVVHTADKHHHHHRLKVFLDANDNGRFDKKDELIGVSKLKNMHSHRGVGGILDSGEIGSVEVEFKRKPSMRTDDSSLPLAERGDNVTVIGSAVGGIVQGILFYAADESLVANINPVGILENFGDG